MIPLVLLPGMMCDARLFGPQIEVLSASNTLHLPPISNHDNIADLAEEVLLAAPPRFALAGLSMGGIVAMEMLRKSPERIDRLALLDTNPKAEIEEVKAGREPQIEKAMEGKLRQVMAEEMKPNYLADGPRRSTILDLCMDMAEALGPEVFVNQSRALQGRRDQCETLGNATVPTLLLCGGEDKLCPVERHEFMHSLIPHSRLVVVPEAGHLTTLEQPDAVNAALRQWMEA